MNTLAHIYTLTSLSLSLSLYIYIYIYVCVCVCGERENKRETFYLISVFKATVRF